MADFSFEIKNSFGVLGTSGKENEYSKEFNFISYCGRAPSYDIRSWTLNKETNEKRMGKGITLSAEEAHKLRELLNQLDV